MLIYKTIRRQIPEYLLFIITLNVKYICKDFSGKKNNNYRKNTVNVALVLRPTSFTPFSFNASYQLTSLLNLRHFIFSWTLVGWLRTWILREFVKPERGIWVIRANDKEHAPSVAKGRKLFIFPLQITQNKLNINCLFLCYCKKIKQSRYRPGVTQRVPES